MGSPWKEGEIRLEVDKVHHKFFNMGHSLLWIIAPRFSRFHTQESLHKSTAENVLLSFLLFDVIVIVACCCKLNNTRDCDEHLIGQVNTHTGHYQLPLFHCTILHQ